MPCAECAEKDAIIAELEAALERAIVLDDARTTHLADALSITYQEAQVVEILHGARLGFVSAANLETALPPLPKGEHRRSDPDFRPRKYTSVVVAHIRSKLGRTFIENKNHSGYRLSAPARKMVAAILEGVK